MSDESGYPFRLLVRSVSAIIHNCTFTDNRAMEIKSNFADAKSDTRLGASFNTMTEKRSQFTLINLVKGQNWAIK